MKQALKARFKFRFALIPPKFSPLNRAFSAFQTPSQNPGALPQANMTTRRWRLNLGQRPGIITKVQRHRRASYQPGATPQVHTEEDEISAESATQISVRVEPHKFRPSRIALSALFQTPSQNPGALPQANMTTRRWRLNLGRRPGIITKVQRHRCAFIPARGNAITQAQPHSVGTSRARTERRQIVCQNHID
jgi:hypothetical protein